MIVRGGPQNGLQIGFSPSEFARSHGLSRVLQQGRIRTRRGNLSYGHQARKQEHTAAEEFVSHAISDSEMQPLIYFNGSVIVTMRSGF